MLRTIKSCGWMLLLVLLVARAQAFSLWGPVGNGGDSYQAQTLSYEYLISASCPLGPVEYIGAPKNIGEEYRRNFNVLYYTYDASFLDYFGALGANAIDKGFLIYSNYLSVPQTNSLEIYALEAGRVNYRAQALQLYDLKSISMEFLTESLGLAWADNWVWCLRLRRDRPGGCPNFQYDVIQRNFDYATWLPSKYVNGVLYTYYIDESCPTCSQSDATELLVDPLAKQYTAVSSHFAATTGVFFTGLTRDDMGGFRYLMRTNNLNFEGLTTDAEIINGGFTNTTSQQVLTTVDLALFAARAATNNGAVLAALYPNLQIASTTVSNVLISVTNYFPLLTNFANSEFTITNTTVPQLLWVTNNLALLAQQSLTNDAAAFAALYPTVLVRSEQPIFTNVVSTNISIGYTNYPWSPAGSLPSVVFLTNTTTTVATYYNRSFYNVVTNRIYSNAVTLTYTTNIFNTQPYSIPGTFTFSVNTASNVATNTLGGTYYVLPTNICAYSIISTQLTYTSYTTNLVINSVLSDGTSITRSQVRLLTNDVYVVYPVSCYSTNALTTISNTPGTNYFHTFDNVVTNIFSASSRVTILTTNITPCGGGLLCTNVVVTNILTNQLSGSIYILPTNQCGLSIVSTQYISEVAATNFLASVTNNQGIITNQAVVYYATNYNVLINPVSCTPGAGTGTATGTNNAAVRQGIDRIYFVRRDYDSLVGTFFQPATNTYILNAVLNNQLVPQTVRRITRQPDILFSARDLLEAVITRSTSNIFTSFAVNGLAGPGILQNQVEIAFNKTGPMLFNLTASGLDESTALSIGYWGSFDGSTNAPTVYPSDLSIALLDNQIVMKVLTTVLPDGTVNTPYSTTTLTGSGGQQPYTWSVAANSASGLPTGLTLSSNGTISGTPAAGTAGIYDVTIQMTEATGRVIVQEFTFTIH